MPVPYVWWHSCASPSTLDVCRGGARSLPFSKRKNILLVELYLGAKASAEVVRVLFSYRTSCLCSKISALVGKCETQRTRKVGWVAEEEELRRWLEVAPVLACSIPFQASKG